MHIVFMPYGKRSEVELLLRDMEAQKFKFKLWKDKKEKFIWLQSQIRILPFGVYEYVFPKEDLDAVLTTLDFKLDRYNLGKTKIAFLRKMIKCQPIPKYKEDNKYLWIRNNVQIIPIGIREDKDLLEVDPGEHIGWTHEAI